MPDFTYSGPGVMFYPETRDATGHHLGAVCPGDIRDLDKAPDQWWHETADDERTEAAAKARQAEDPASEGETGDADEAPEAPEPSASPGPDPQTDDQTPSGF